MQLSLLFQWDSRPNHATCTSTRPLQARVREAIDSIRADTGKYEHYAADPQVLAVLQVRARSAAFCVFV